VKVRLKRIGSGRSTLWQVPLISSARTDMDGVLFNEATSTGKRLIRLGKVALSAVISSAEPDRRLNGAESHGGLYSGKQCGPCCGRHASY